MAKKKKFKLTKRQVNKLKLLKPSTGEEIGEVYYNMLQAHRRQVDLFWKTVGKMVGVQFKDVAPNGKNIGLKLDHLNRIVTVTYNDPAEETDDDECR